MFTFIVLNNNSILVYRCQTVDGCTSTPIVYIRTILRIDYTTNPFIVFTNHVSKFNRSFYELKTKDMTETFLVLNVNDFTTVTNSRMTPEPR